MCEVLKSLRASAGSAPKEPGVYKMKDKDGKILYIGKAKSLRSRVQSYFRDSPAVSSRIAVMVGKVRSVEFVVTASELEALILEDNLIKKELPPYNVLLKDDKSYPYLKLTLNETYPRLVIARKVEKGGGAYFGPYVSGKSVRYIMKLIHKVFPLRQSRDKLDGKALRRPCLNYQMERCLAPCAGKVSSEEYKKVVEEVSLFLKGKNKELLENLKQKMEDASDKELFEIAGKVRDQIEAINRISEKQSMSVPGIGEEDVVASWEEGEKSVIKLFQVRCGKVVGEKSFQFEKLGREDRGEALAAFIRQFYSENMKPPPVIITNQEPDGFFTLGERLSAFAGFKVSVETPSRGRKKRLVEMAERNARLSLASMASSVEAKEKALEEIKNLLGLEKLPSVVEAYDISNTGGIYPVGSVVTFRDGEPAKDGYRKYSIKSVKGANDYASLAEVVERRHKRLFASKLPFADLLVIDGGKGQVSAVLKRFDEIGLLAPPVVGISKGGDRENVETDIFIARDGTEVGFPAYSHGRFLLQRARDEAHRFAISYHRKKRGEELTRSVLDSIPGVGPKRKKALLKKFGSVKRIREASLTDIQKTLKVSESSAKKIFESL